MYAYVDGNIRENDFVYVFVSQLSEHLILLVAFYSPVVWRGDAPQPPPPPGVFPH